MSKGLLNALAPSSPIYPEGAAYVSDNSRIDKDGSWNKGPALTNVAEDGYDEQSDVGDNITIIRTPNNTKFTCAAAGTVSGGASAAVTPPTTAVAKSGSLIGTRQESGLYYYMGVTYNTTNKLESLPSNVIEHWVRRYYIGDTRQPDVPVLSGGAANTRWYRSKRVIIKMGDTQQLGQINSPIEFFFIGEGSGWNDYANDRELGEQYKGRGSFRPSASIDAIGVFKNRVFYFVAEKIYFSSAGRPDEVAQEYTLTVKQTFSNGTWTNGALVAGGSTDLALTQKPLLDTGIYAEAIIKVPDLLGESVVRAQEINNKLWLWTNDMTGYIEETTKNEGFRFVKVANGFGLCSPWTLTSSPYGMFGADKRGIWLLTGDSLKRITEGRIDINDSNKTTYVNPSNLAASFGAWVGELNEYWWDVNGTQIVYQADVDRFVGPYNLSVADNAAYIDGMYQTHLVRSSTTPILNARTGVQTLKFWLGQESSPFIKDRLKMEILYKSITAAKTVTVNTYQNNIASETGAAASDSWSHTDDNLIGLIEPIGSGRFFEVKLAIPTDCTAPIAAITYEAEPVPRTERHGR